MIKINGTEGGGQMLRSALSLSLITGQPFHMENIRGKRSKPGLKRQHLSCVLAALKVCNGSADGAEMLSEELIFNPGELKAGDYHINIGSAGSTTLVAQTLIPALVHLKGASHLIIEGGTHNPMAPTYDFFKKYYLENLQKMGYKIEAELVKAGFAPAGGGKIEIAISPVKSPSPLIINKSAELTSQKVIIYHYNLSQVVAKLSKLFTKKIKGIEIEVRECVEAECSGLTVQLENTYGNSYTLATEMVAEYGLSSEGLAQKLNKTHHSRLAPNAPVCNRLADQLMLFIASTPESEIITGPITNHIKTNADVINSFLPKSLVLDDLEAGKIKIMHEG